ncbi:MAG: hypothetical protein KF718_33365 [Polyangiaceae bacterium]|nr:hypothetical protein [Polyangiaceae bacterium]
MTQEHDTEPPPTDPFGSAADVLRAETSEKRTALIFSTIVREEMKEQIDPVRATLETLTTRQVEQLAEIRGLAKRVTALEVTRLIVPVTASLSALIVALASLGAVVYLGMTVGR